MTLVASPPRTEAAERPASLSGRAVVFIGTILVIVALAVLPLLTPWFTHAALDAAGAADRLGVAETVAHRLSDRSVEALVVTGAFDITAPDGRPLYDASEQAHLGDARTLLWLCLLSGAASLGVIGALYARGDGPTRRHIWHTISVAGRTTVLAVIGIGLISLVAFGTLFTLFHQLAFPGGNWSFDPQTQRLVQLYPFRFWQIAAAMFGLLVVAISLVTWLLGRRFERRHGSAA